MLTIYYYKYIEQQWQQYQDDLDEYICYRKKKVLNNAEVSNSNKTMEFTHLWKIKNFMIGTYYFVTVEI